MSGPGIQVELMLHPSQVAVVDVLADCLVVRVLDRCGRLGPHHAFITPSAAADFLVNDRGTDMSDTNYCVDCTWCKEITDGGRFRDQIEHFCTEPSRLHVVTKIPRLCSDFRRAQTCEFFRADDLPKVVS